MAESTIVKTNRDGKWVFYDYADSHNYEVAYERGNIQMNVPGPTIMLVLDRGRFTSPPAIRYDQDQPITWQFEADLRDIHDAGYATLAQLILGQTPPSWVSRMGSTGEVKAWKCVWTIEGTDHGDSADHTLTTDYNVVSGSLSEGAPSSISVSGTSYQLYPTLT